jgi:hypothetical protein
MIPILTNVATLVAFLVFIVPGFASLRTYEALRGGERQPAKDAIIDIVILGFFSDIVAVPILLACTLIANAPLRIATICSMAVLTLGGLPVLIGVSWYQLHKRLARAGAVAHPTLKPWDDIFTRIVRDKLQIGVILSLHDGRKLGGRYVDPGFASEYPADEQILIGESWEIDQDTGKFKQKADGTFGLLIDKRDVLTVELVYWESVELYLPDADIKDTYEPEDLNPEGAAGTDDYAVS